MAFLLLCWFVLACICALIASAKDRSAIGWFILGFLFGPLALLFAAAMSSAPKVTHATVHPTKKCPVCAEQVHVDALRCKHCQHEFGALIEQHPMQDQWQEEFEKSNGRKARWGSSPDSKTE